jgi:hypothetical protein
VLTVAALAALAVPGHGGARARQDDTPVARVENELRAHPLRTGAPALADRVHRIACRLRPDRCATLRVYLLRRPGPQARMLPGGALVVHTGLLLRLRDEDELAFVVAHELAHDGEAATRGDDEPAADAAAIAMLRATGFDPGAAARLLVRLRDEGPVAATPPAAGTHATFAERLDALPAIPDAPASRAPADPAWPAASVPSLREWLGDEIRFGGREPTRAMLEAAVGGPGPDPGTRVRAEFAFALAEHVRRFDGITSGATARYAEAAAGGVTPGWRELGFARLAAGDAIAGREALERYLAEAPGAPDAAYVRWRLDGPAAVAAGAPAAPPAGRALRVLGLRLHSPLRWTRTKGVGAEVWAPAERTGGRLFVVSGVRAGEPMLRAIVPAAPGFVPGARPDDTVERVVLALHALGRTDLRWTGLRPHGFGGVAGWRAALTAAGASGEREHGELAFAEREGRLTLLLWLAPAGPGHDADRDTVATMLDTMRFAR